MRQNCNLLAIDGGMYCEKHVNVRRVISKKSACAKKAAKKVTKRRVR